MSADTSDTPDAQQSDAVPEAAPPTPPKPKRKTLRGALVAFEDTVLHGHGEVVKAREQVAKRPPLRVRPGSKRRPEPVTGTSAEPGASPAPLSAAAEEALCKERAGKTILIVDDEEDVRTIVRTVLENAGYVVLEAANGQEALDLVCAPAPAPAPATIILDLWMPLLSGPEMMGLYRALPRPPNAPLAPVLVMTAATHAQKRAHEIGADGHVGKPFRLDDLLAEVDRLALSLPAPAGVVPAPAARGSERVPAAPEGRTWPPGSEEPWGLEAGLEGAGAGT